jgi:hypothetical protein
LVSVLGPKRNSEVHLGEAIKRDASEAGLRASVRLFLMVLAPIEFVVTILGGALLYLFKAAFLYLGALCALFRRAAALLVLRFTKGRVFTSVGRATSALPLSESSPGVAVGQGRASSWLN